MTVALDAGTYEVLRSRLGEHCAELGRRAEALNTRRVSTFGSAELRLLGTERIRTENNCVPRDVAQVGGAMLFGYNVFIGLRSETTVDDVFATHGFVRDGDAFRFDPAAFFAAITAVLAGIALSGTNRSTLDEVTAAIGEREARRRAMIDGLGLRLVEN